MKRRQYYMAAGKCWLLAGSSQARFYHSIRKPNEGSQVRSERSVLDPTWRPSGLKQLGAGVAEMVQELDSQSSAHASSLLSCRGTHGNLHPCLP